jgi:pimeloyl-ACP methyl ester carboxylesterase
MPTPPSDRGAAADRMTGFDRDGLHFDLVDRGPLDGPVVVLLHGFPERASSWDGVVPHLHDAGFRTVRPDQRGYSPGARPRGRRAYALPELVADLDALVDALGGGPVHLVGHDWGAIVAWAYAGHHGDRVRTLATVSVGHPAAFLRSVAGPQALRSWYVGAFQLPAVPERLAARRGGVIDRLLATSGMRPADLARFREQVVEYGALPGGLAWYRALPLLPPGWARRRVEVPTTFVWSDGDTACSRAQAERTAGWVDGPYRFHVLHGVSHWVPEHAADRLAPLLLDGFAAAGGASGAGMSW